MKQHRCDWCGSGSEPEKGEWEYDFEIGYFVQIERCPDCKSHIQGNYAKSIDTTTFGDGKEGKRIKGLEIKSLEDDLG